MSTRRKKLLYIVAATVGMSLVIGAAVMMTLKDGPQPLMLPSLVGLWLGIVWALTVVVRDYKALDNSTLHVTFKTDRPLLGSEACQALAAGRSFTVSLSTPDGPREITGKVLSVDLLEHMKPIQWKIVIRVSR